MIRGFQGSVVAISLTFPLSSTVSSLQKSGSASKSVCSSSPSSSSLTLNYSGLHKSTGPYHNNPRTTRHISALRHPPSLQCNLPQWLGLKLLSATFPQSQILPPAISHLPFPSTHPSSLHPLPVQLFRFFIQPRCPLSHAPGHASLPLNQEAVFPALVAFALSLFPAC